MLRCGSSKIPRVLQPVHSSSLEIPTQTIYLHAQCKTLPGAFQFWPCATKTRNCRCFHRYTMDCISRLLLYIISLPCFLESYLPSGVTIVCIWCDWCFMGFMDWFENCEAVTLTKLDKNITFINDLCYLERFLNASSIAPHVSSETHLRLVQQSSFWANWVLALTDQTWDNSLTFLMFFWASCKRAHVNVEGGFVGFGVSHAPLLVSNFRSGPSEITTKSEQNQILTDSAKSLRCIYVCLMKKKKRNEVYGE